MNDEVKGNKERSRRLYEEVFGRGNYAAADDLMADRARLAAYLVAPGVHADDQLRVRFPDGRDERDCPSDFLVHVNLVAGPGRHAADIDDVCAFCYYLVHSLQRDHRVPGDARPVEGVRSPESGSRWP
jgi:hypothetical protein